MIRLPSPTAGNSGRDRILRYGATHTRETSPEDVEESKPEPDIFEVVLKKLKIDGNDAVAIGDSPDDAEAAGKLDVRTIGVLCGGFTESEHRKAGCVDVYPGPAALSASFDGSLPAK